MPQISAYPETTSLATGDFIIVEKSGASNTSKFDAGKLVTDANAVAVTLSDTAATKLISSQNSLTANAISYTDSNGSLASGPPLASVKRIPIAIEFNGGGSAIAANTKVDIRVPFAATIAKWTLLADQSGSIVIDVWRDTYANYPPTVADTITASAKPTISSATNNESSTLTGWTTSVTSGDCLRFNVDSITTITRCTLILEMDLA